MNRPRLFPALLLLALSALACQVQDPATWTPSVPQATAIELNKTYQAEATRAKLGTMVPAFEAPDPTSTPTATSSIVEVTPCQDPICEISPMDVPAPVGNYEYREMGLPLMGTRDEILKTYYAPSDAESYGYLTRYGSNEFAAGVAVWQLGHFREQLKRGQLLLGGNYSSENQRDGQWSYGITPPRTSAQWRLLDLAERTEGMTREQAIAVLLAEFDYIVAMKSPNDIGRMFCVFDDEGKFEGRAFVGDTSALHDYTGIGGTDGLPLGYRVTLSPAGQDAHWLADVPTSLWNRARRGDNAWARFVENCEVMI